MNSNFDSTLNASMIIKETRSFKMGLFLTFLLILGLSLYFSVGINTLKPAHYLPLALFALGLVLSLVFFPLSASKNSDIDSPAKNKVLFILFQLLQGGIGFALCHFVFNLGFKGALVFPAGALVAALIFLFHCHKEKLSTAWMIAAALGAGGLTIALRLQGVWGGLLFGIALLQGAWIGLRLTVERDAQLLWVKSLFFIGFLVLGRTAIQYYLLKSNYIQLGVVISQPYTFIALCAGVFVPFAYFKIDSESLLPCTVSFILIGLVLPLALGVFIHVRPMAAYLMGLTLSTFAVGALGSGSLSVGLLSYLNMAVVALALPLFQKSNGLDRILRLEILGAVAVFSFLVLLMGSKLKKQE